MKHTSNWTREAAFLEEQGVYEKAADLIDLGQKGRHVDMASGEGHLLRELRLRQEKAFLAGLEVDPGRFQHAWLETWIGNGMGTFPIPQSEPLLRPKRGSRQIVFVEGDVREPERLEEVMGGKPLDSVSFTCTGLLKRLKEDQTSKQLIHETRQAVMDFAIRHVKPGGKFVYGERVAGMKKAPDADAIWKNLRKGFAGQLRFWERGASDSLVVQYPEDIARNSTDALNYALWKHKGLYSAVVFQEFKRNKRESF
jgi:SAM-dependent methyltransferase